MSRTEFMHQLELLLQDLPEADRLDAITYYNDYFDEAGPENQQQVIQELGSPQKVAATIKEQSIREDDVTKEERDVHSTERGFEQNRQFQHPIKKEKHTRQHAPLPPALIIVLLVFASPILLAIGGGIIGILAGIAGALIGILVGILGGAGGGIIGGVVGLVISILEIPANPLLGLAHAGICFLTLAVGLLFFLFGTYLVIKWLPALCKSIFCFFRKLFQYKRS